MSVYFSSQSPPNQIMITRSEEIAALNEVETQFTDFSGYQDDEAVLNDGNPSYLASSCLQSDSHVASLALCAFESVKKKADELNGNPPRRPLDRRFWMSSKEASKETLKDLSPLLFSIPSADERCSVFIRDSHIGLLEGGFLIPYSIKNFFICHYFLANLPASVNHFLIKDNDRLVNETGMGKGFERRNVNQAIFTAEYMRIPYEQGKTCIEGGNCFLYWHEGKPKAIIGELSLYLSLIALEEQRYFEKIEWTAEDTEPSDEAYRLARNRDLYATIQFPKLAKKWDARIIWQINNNSREELHLEEEDIPWTRLIKMNLKELAYRKRLIAPLTEKEKKKYAANARKLEAKLRLTKQRMAQELRVPLANCVFIPQDHFHIDMQMFVTPDGKVVLHDNKKALKFLNVIEKSEDLTRKERLILRQFQKKALKGMEKCGANQKKRIALLKKQGVSVLTMPAVFNADYPKVSLNYCNGIFLDGKKGAQLFAKEKEGEAERKQLCFVTTGPSHVIEEMIHKKFTRLFSCTFTNMALYTIAELSSFIANKKGGVRCLTNEEHYEE
ncbi:hypothetical protein [Candidatus Protochlamydia phocaeensis]|uniref:hypothetical protein n=1 Tax=Candidatus Protochlamydia phocaeensis TaxID=1414722 RepID=UPI000838CBD8|nr:hypothetical protein [Candidatus Protochlamydia phocaeensis]